tara:strand:+ start:96 stop:878 length:783 start_codon:yes stop_codon:yes gene_type:complete
MDLELAQLIILIISAFITSAISAVLGMGGGIILLGIMAIIIPEGYMVIALHGMIQLFSNSTRTYIFRQHIKKNVIKNFSIGALIGATISGLIIFILIQFFNVDSANQIKVDFLKPVIGVFIIWYLFIKGSKGLKNKKESTSFIKVGGISGISSIFIGATGPLIAPFFLNSKFKKDNIIANKAAGQMITHLTKIPLFIYFFNVSYIGEYSILLPLIAAVYIGTNLGKKILSFIPEKTFKILFKLCLSVIAVRLIFGPILFN